VVAQINYTVGPECFFHIVNQIIWSKMVLLIDMSNFHGLKTRHESYPLCIQALVNFKPSVNIRKDICLSKNLKKLGMFVSEVSIFNCYYLLLSPTYSYIHNIYILYYNLSTRDH